MKIRNAEKGGGSTKKIIQLSRIESVPVDSSFTLPHSHEYGFTDFS
jgi:hypothetical protein